MQRMEDEPESVISYDTEIKTEIKLEGILCSDKLPEIVDPQPTVFNLQEELVHFLASIHNFIHANSLYRMPRLIMKYAYFARRLR